MESKMMKAGEIGTVYGDTTLGRDRKVVFKYLKGFWMAQICLIPVGNMEIWFRIKATDK